MFLDHFYHPISVESSVDTFRLARDNGINELPSFSSTIDDTCCQILALSLISRFSSLVYITEKFIRENGNSLNGNFGENGNYNGSHSI